MKSRDKILFAFPLIITASIAAIASVLFWHVSKFEDSYLREQQQIVEVETKLVAKIITPMLAAGDTQKAVDFCHQANCDETRLSLIRRDGAVLADSSTAESSLDNHAERPEIRRAFAGTPSSETRYSATLNTWMIYYAMPISLPGGNTYVLRLAKSNKDIGATVSLGKTNTVLALALGAAVALLLTFYIFLRIRRPLEILQQDAFAIASGDLHRKIIVPEAGVLRDLALTISRMAEQLKLQISQITDERNEREFIFNALSEGAIQVERDGNVILHNAEAAKIFGLPPAVKSTDGTTALPHFNLARCGSSDLLRMAFKIFDDGKSREQEIAIERNSGTITLLVRGGLVVRNGEKYLLLTVSDLTNLRTLESFRSDFIANVSHEIKTPLTSILSAVESLSDGAMQKPELADKFLKILNAQSSRLNALVQDILSLASLERREIADEKELLPVQLDASLENAVNLCAPAAEKAGIQLLVKHNVPIQIPGDAQLIEQALINLIGNAIKYSASPQIEVNLEQDAEGSATIQVQDFGVGIPTEHLPRIFERFYRVHKERSQKLGGTGLGLAIVKHVMQLHGGTASVESVPGVKTSFVLTFPLKPSADSEQ